MTVRGTWAAVTLATVWSVGLLAGAATVPVYRSETVSSRAGGPATISHSSATLVEANGSGVLVVVAIPLVASLLVAIALLRPRVGWFARGVAWSSTGAVGLLGLVAILTIGIAIIPVALLLVTACVLDLGRTPTPA